MRTERKLNSKAGDPAKLKKDGAVVGYKAPAVQKAFRLLEAVARSGEGMGISEISEELGFSKGTTHGLIQALLEVGALEQSPFRKKVFLGASLVELAKKAMNYNGVATDAQPILDALGKEINEAVFLGVLNSNQSHHHRPFPKQLAPGDFFVPGGNHTTDGRRCGQGLSGVIKKPCGLEPDPF